MKNTKFFTWPAILGTAALLGCSPLIDTLAGNFHLPPSDLGAQHAEAAEALKAAFLNVDSYNDHHIHLFSEPDDAETGPSPSRLSCLPAAGPDQIQVSTKAVGGGLTRWFLKQAINSVNVVDTHYGDYAAQALQRIFELAAAIETDTQVTLNLLAMDKTYNAQKKEVKDETPFYVSNEFILEAVACMNGELIRRRSNVRFRAVMSVHPDNPRAIENLREFAHKDVHFVKWRPPTQGIDPSLPRYDRFYQVMREEGLTLISHTGNAEGIKGPAGSNRLADPKRLERALMNGVDVIMAHTGRSGPGNTHQYFDDALTMLEHNIALSGPQARQRGKLYGEMAAIQVGKLRLRFSDLVAWANEGDGLSRFCRIVDGSDYPVTAAYAAFIANKLRKSGMINKKQEQIANTIYHYNPVLYDFYLKRVAHSVSSDYGQPGQTLDPIVFSSLDFRREKCGD